MQEHKRYLLFPLIIILVILFQISCEKDSKITKDMAIRLANDELLKNGYDNRGRKLRVTMRHGSRTERNTTEGQIKSIPHDLDVKVKDKTYWIIYYYIPGEDVKGGDATIIIDAENGDILAKYLGE